MDPLSALSLSCNVLDLITAAGKTCAFLYDVHKAGAFPTHQELVSATTLLDTSSQALAHALSDSQNPGQARRADDKVLFDIAQNAKKLASDLQKKLEALQVLPTDSRTKRFKKLLETALQKGKIYDLQRRWTELSKAVDSALLKRLTVETQRGATNTRDQFRDLERKIGQGLSGLNDLDQEMRKQNEITRVAVTTEARLTRDKVDAQAETNRRHTSQEATKSRGVTTLEADKTNRHVTAENATTRQTLSKEIRGTKQFVVNDLRRHIRTAHKTTQSNIEQGLAFRQRQDLDNKMTARFINSFRFPELNARRNQITEPHSETYEWIFRDDPRSRWDSFSDWLRSSTGMYWINGKAGSGKSTLMHFICEHQKTRELLNQWSAPHETQLISWYFWNSGSHIQRSLNGALCALLHQILSQRPDVARHFLGQYGYFSHSESPADWSQTALLDLLRKIFSFDPGYVVMFLDGLDEFDREEDVLVLLNLLRSISNDYTVKICLSSRPESRIELELGQLPQLRLQDMTTSDIRQYVDDTLRKTFPNWNQLQFEQFRWEVTRKADGVFLWVHVALRSLQQGSAHSDDYNVLMERLELFPAKMESLYEHMWLSLNGDGDLPTYRKEAALFFSFHDYFPLDVIYFILATDKDLCAAASDATQADTSLESLYEKSKQIDTLLRTRCAGLLEIGFDQGDDVDDEEAPGNVGLSTTECAVEFSTALKNLGRVQFFHRTAKDFLLDKPSGQELLKSYQLSRQDVVERLLKAYLATRICGVHHPSDLEHTLHRPTEYEAIESAILLIRDLDPAGGDEQVADSQYQLLQLVESTYQQTIVPVWDGFIDQSCKRNWFLRVCPSPSSPDFWGEVMRNILSSALTTKILRNGPQDKIFATHLLLQLTSSYGYTYNEADLRSVQHLLDAGADPNANHFQAPQNTVWQQFVMSFMNQVGFRPENIEIAAQPLIFQTVKCFLHHGANVCDQTLAFRSKGASGQDVHSPTLEFFDTIRLGVGLLEAGEVISIVNVIYLLRRLALALPRAWEESHLEDIAAVKTSTPSCQNLAVVGRNHKLYRLLSDEPDPLDIPLQLDATARVQSRYLEYPQFFPPNRQVGLRTLLQEQAPATVLGIYSEGRDGWIEDLRWSYQHLQARRVLHGFDKFEYRGHFGTIDCIRKSSLLLSSFLGQFGFLTESILFKEQLDAVQESSWPKICSKYDSYLHDINCGCGGDPEFLLENFDADFQDLAGLLNAHGLKKLGFQGKHIALDETGARIPWCSEKPAVCDASHTDRYKSLWGFPR